MFLAYIIGVVLWMFWDEAQRVNNERVNNK